MDASLLAHLLHRLSALSPIWHVLWGGLVLLSVALVVLSRTRWGQSRPLRKCAVLSLLAHVLLACFATTVKIVSSPELHDANPAIHVALVSGEVGTRSEEETVPQTHPWEGLQAGPISRPDLPPWERSQESESSQAIDFTEPFSGNGDLPEKWTLPPPENIAVVEPQLPEPADVPGGGLDTPLEPAPVDLPKREVIPPATLQPRLLSAGALQVEREEGDVAAEPDLDSLEPEWLTASSPDTAAVEKSVALPAIEDPPEAILPKQVIAEPREVPHGYDSAEATPLPAGTLGPPTPSVEEDRGAALEVNRPPTSPQTVAEGSGPAELRVDRPSVYRHRRAAERPQLVEDHGGTEETEVAVQKALLWLARAQSRDGRWDVVRHGGGREQAVLGHNRQGAGMQADAGVTGLALLAFLGAGHTHHDGNHKENVQRGLDYLVRLQKSDGNVAGPAALYAHMYCHAMASFALSEAYAMTGDAALREPVRRAIAYTIEAQHAGGGWRYRPGEPGDTSQLGWQLMTLRSAELAGFSVPEESWQRAGRFLESVSRGRAGGLAAYQPGAGVSRPMSAEATFCKLLLADRTGRLASLDATCEEAAEYLRDELPGAGRANLYYWYYATLLLHLRQHASPSADRDWQVWNEALMRTLLASQYKSGPLEGAWGSETMWGGYGGRVYTTALATLSLEAYYRYLPLLNRRDERTAPQNSFDQRAFDTRGEADKINR